MNLITIFKRFPNQKSCIRHLELVRWAGTPCCAYCGSVDVARKVERERVGRWNCHDCKSSFNVLAGTIFRKTKIPLQKWFLAIGLILNAKKSLSSHQLARDLELTQPTAWYLQVRIRAEMASGQSSFLEGIVETDETYLGGKPRKKNNRDGGPKNPRGRGTSKTPVIGAVERGGKVVAQVATDLTGRGVLEFIRGVVNPKKSVVVTDEYPAYRAIRSAFRHAVINHSESYVQGERHTNTIEGFWSLLKRAWYGSHHHYRESYIPLYLAEACWKYNNRDREDAFDVFMHGCFD